MSNNLPTVVFADLAGSTAIYEALGSERMAAVMDQITQWMDRVFQAHGGRTVKLLGDGAMAVFPTSLKAVNASIFLQQGYQEARKQWPSALHAMGLKIGMASGPVVKTADQDVLGEPVNLAARLCDMAGAETIWVDQSVINQLPDGAPTGPGALFVDRSSLWPQSRVHHRPLGLLRVPGLSVAQAVSQIFWDPSFSPDQLTRPASLEQLRATEGGDAQQHVLSLSWLDQTRTFSSDETAIEIGRQQGQGFQIDDPRVSRRHARIVWSNGVFELTDMSSYGTWVRLFGEHETEVVLRRTSCLLHACGEIALGAPFSDFSAPVINFQVSTGS